MFVLEKREMDPTVIQYQPPRDPISRIKRHLRRRILARDIGRYRDSAPAGVSFFTDDRTVYGPDPWKYLPESDLLHLHWISLFVDYITFFGSLPSGKPLVWTMHGMEAITGGCHYDGDCGRFTQRCGACPQLGSDSEADLTRQVWQRKRDSYDRASRIKLHLVSPSRWLREQTSRSSLLSRFSCSVIPNGLDTDVFAPRDRRFARESLGVPLDARVLLFLADGVDDPRKGFQLLRRAVADADLADRLFLLSVGPGRLDIQRDVPHLHINNVQHDGILSCIYSASDLLVVPSLQDNLPNTILESLACGVPVAGFATGGVPDAVRPGLTGLLAPTGDVAQLRKIISELLRSDDKRAEMSRSCRQIAVEEYSLKTQAKRYAHLYEELVGRGS